MASTDVLLVTAAHIEGKTVLEVFEAAIGQPARAHEVGDRTFLHLGVLDNHVRVDLVMCEMGSAGIGGSLITVQKAIEALSPKFVIMVGIAFGTDKGKQKLGDVLVAQNLALYESQGR